MTTRPAPAHPSFPINPDKLGIVEYPHPLLMKKAGVIPATPPSPDASLTHAVIARMVALMFEADGIGLAAPQVGLPWRMFVLHVPESPHDKDPADRRSASDEPPTATTGPRVYIDPRITSLDGPVQPLEEGCLSLPDIRGTVLRPPRLVVSARNEHGTPFTHTAAGLLARCIQHELDHLDGVLIIDKMPLADRTRHRKRLRDLQRDWDSDLRPGGS